MTGSAARHTPTLTGNNRIRLVVADSGLIPAISDTLTTLLEPWGWLEVGDSVDDIVTACWQMVADYYDDMMIGAVFPFLCSVPDGWLLLDGSTYNKVDYPLLYDKLPSQLKTETTFTLPDITDRFPLGTDILGDIGDIGGSSSVTLTVDQLPAHTHTYIPPTISEIDVEAPGAPLPSTGIGSATATGSAGSNNSIDITNPFLRVLFAVYAGQ